jgi:hypothetical protein
MKMALIADAASTVNVKSLSEPAVFAARAQE